MKRFLLKAESICCIILSTFPKALCSFLYIWALYALAFDLLPKCFGGLIGLITSVTTFIIATLGLYTYFLVVATGPGSPLDFHDLQLPLDDDLETQHREPPEYLQSKTVTVKNNGAFRFCNKCRVWKPDRCHHCSSCKRCVLKMDHHCPWFATCIGFKNHRYFIQFLSLTFIYGLITTLLSSIVLYKFFTNEEYLDSYFSLNYLFLFILGITIFLSVGIFDGFSIYQVLRNVTTLESYDLQTYRSHSSNPSAFQYSDRPNSGSIGNVFDLGWKQNWRSVMGPTWKEWFLPVAINSDIEDLSYRNGLNFEVNPQVYSQLMENARIQNELYEQLQNYRNQKKQLLQELLDEEQETNGTRYGQFV